MINMVIEYLPIAGAMSAVVALILTVKHVVNSRSKVTFVRQDSIKKIDIRNHILERRLANEAIFSLSSYAQKIDPDFVVGLNIGGTMVGAFISLGLGVPGKRFSRCLVSGKNRLTVNCDVKNMHGTVLVIDDVSRSGRTIEAAINDIKHKNINIKRVFSAVLVTALGEEGKSSYKNLDYYSYITSDKDVYLPWTPRIKEKPDQENIRVKLFKEVRKKSLNKIAIEISNCLYTSRKAL